MHGKSLSITTDHNILPNESKLVDLVMRIKLTPTILSRRFTDFLRNSTIDFCMFFACNMFCERRDFVAKPVTSCIHVSIYPYRISEGRRNVRACGRYSNETVTLRKQVTKYKNMLELMVECLVKSESGGYEIAQVK